MGLTGKYNFVGIQKAARVAINAALAATTFGQSVWFKIFSPVEDVLIDDAVNWMANEGLIIIDIGAILIGGKLDQSAFDKAMNDGLDKMKIGNLSEREKRDIDDAVIKAFRDFGRVTRPDQLPDVPSV